MNRVLLCLVSIISALIFSAPAMGAEPDDPEKKSGGAEQIASEKGGAPVYAYYKNDFYLATPDGMFELRIRGNVHLDSKWTINDDSANPNTYDLRRARIDMQGVLYHDISFRVQAELADNPYIRNAWADYTIAPWLHLRGGQMKPPFSTAWITMDNNLNFIERATSTPIYPYFDRGWMIWGQIMEGGLTYSLGSFTGAGMDLDYRKGDVDDHKDTFVRFFASPFIKSDLEPIKNIHFALQGCRGEQSIPTARFEQRGLAAPIRDDTLWRWNTEAVGEGEIGRRDRYGLELHYIWGPFSLSGEYLAAQYYDLDVIALDGKKAIDVDGKVVNWSVWASVFLTGESKKVGADGWRQPAPAKDFNPLSPTGPGAWEILARYSETTTDQALFHVKNHGGNPYSALVGAERAIEYSAGLCWTWNPMVRWQINYTHIETKDDDIRTGDAAYRDGTAMTDSDDIIALRMIFKF